MTPNPYNDADRCAVLFEALGDAPVARVEDFEQRLTANLDSWRADIQAVPRGRDYAALIAKYDQQLARSADHLSRVQNLLTEMQETNGSEAASPELRSEGVSQNG